MASTQRYLVVDDLCENLTLHPIYVPIPPKIFVGKDKDAIHKKLVAFTLNVYKDLMKLEYFKWHHSYKDITVDGFSIRFDNIYPNIST